MLKLLGLAVVLHFIADGVHGQLTATVTNTFDTSACTGTLICTLSGTTKTIDQILNVATTKLKFLKGTTTVFELTRTMADAAIDIKDAGGTNTYTVITATEDDAQAATLTFVAGYPITSALVGDWTCSTEDTGGDATLIYSAGTALTIAQSDLGDCATTISMDPCAKTITCDLGASVTAVLAAGAAAVINFKKGTTIMYKIATADTVTDNANAAVTGLTANAPVANAGADLNNARLNFGTTFVTFDSATLDGSWTCDVTGLVAGTDNLVVPYSVASDSTTLSTSCVATISIDACARTMSCTFPTNVDTLQSDSGVISFKRAGTTQFQIASADDAVTSDGSTSVTGVTATAPLGTSTTDAKIARLTFAATATFDSTLDGSWTCEVDAATATNDIASVSTTLSTTCGAAMNKVAGLLVVLMVTIKALLF